MPMSRITRTVAGLALAAAALLAGCVHRTIEVGSAPATGIAPQLVVESFLRAANCVAASTCPTKAQQLESMSRLFGTRDGPIIGRDPRADAEQRMYALASLVESQDYKVQGQNIVPGRVGEAVQLTVLLRQDGRELSVPFVLVRSKNGDWLVEQIDTKALTQRP